MKNLVGKDQHSVNITLNEKVNKFLFTSKDEKDKFIKSENNFCIKEYTNYTCEFTVLQRKLLKVELEKKRLAHSIHCGFQQVAKTGVWTRGSKQDDVVA